MASTDAQVVALQEVDRRFGRRTGLLDTGSLREAGYEIIQVSDLADGHGFHGNAVLVRGGCEVRRRIKLALPGLEPRGALLLDLEGTGWRLRIVAAHLGLLRSSRVRQFAAMSAMMDGLPEMPTVAMGDFNERGIGPSAMGALCDRLEPSSAIGSFPAPWPALPLDRILAWPRDLVTSVAVHDTPDARLASDHLPVVAALDPLQVAV